MNWLNFWQCFRIVSTEVDHSDLGCSFSIRDDIDMSRRVAPWHSRRDHNRPVNHRRKRLLTVIFQTQLEMRSAQRDYHQAFLSVWMDVSADRPSRILMSSRLQARRLSLLEFANITGTIWQNFQIWLKLVWGWFVGLPIDQNMVWLDLLLLGNWDTSA